MISNFPDIIRAYHQNLPERIQKYLNNRGIPDEIIDAYFLGWNGWRITIPVFNKQGRFVFFKLAKDPEDASPHPKMMAVRGSYAELYGWEEVLRKPERLIICEGEFDRLVLEARGFPAVTSTAGAGTFQKEWAKEIQSVSQVYICFDKDDAGRKGAAKLARMIPQAKIVELPEETGIGGDITDFFVRLNKTKVNFLELLGQAKTPPPPKPSCPLAAFRHLSPQLNRRRKQIKKGILIATLIGQHIQLHQYGKNLVGRCPFHNDRNPSLTVYPNTNTFHCFGCGKHGDVISFLQEIEKLSFLQALEVLEKLLSNHGTESQ